MTGVSGLTAQPLNPGRSVNWILLIELLVCGILALFFLFYFNRLFATLVSYGLRAYTWHKYHVYLDIQTLQLSLLGGRLFFKGVRYHGENEIIFVHNGHITWRYWLQSIQHVDHRRFGPSADDSRVRTDHGKSNESLNSNLEEGLENGGIDGEDRRPCRIAIHLSGLEWFIYNRTPAYDTVLKSPAFSVSNEGKDSKTQFATGRNSHPRGVTQNGPNRLTRRSGVSRRTGSESQATSSNIEDFTESADHSQNLFPTETISTTVSTDLNQINEPKNDPSPLLGLLPIQVECNKGAIILGNPNTTILLTNTFERADGKIAASQAGPLDVYRQIFDFEIAHPVVQMRPNPDFKSSQSDTAQKLEDEGFEIGNKTGHRLPRWHLQRKSRRILKTLRGMIPYFQRSVESFRAGSSSTEWEESHMKPRETYTRQGRWLGLARYLDEDAQDDHEAWKNVDYARSSTIVDCPSLNVRFYWDIPGPVRRLSPKSLTDDISQKINGAEQPAYGLDFTIRGGIINYGPWADKARAEIQNVFFPNAFADAIPTKPLTAGEKRQSTTFDIHIDIEEETTLRIPTRESSKDWQWRGRAEAVSDAARLKRAKNKRHARQRKGDKNILGPDIRPFGWLALAIESNSSASIAVDMLPGDVEFKTTVRVDLKGTRMTSSVNHDLLWRCGPQTVSCSLPNPIGWNTLREWTFTIHSQSLDLFILRDHMFLLTDLVNDWSQGPPPHYLTFIPFRYHLNLDFTDLKLYLNTNDANIIDNPADLADNTYLIIAGESLSSRLDIPVDRYRPSQNNIKFDAVLQNVHLNLTTPLWDTFRTLLNEDPLATLKEFVLDGSYNYCLPDSPSRTDSLILNIKGLAPKLYLHGFLIRQFMKINYNYFGEDIHFRTLAEFQAHNLANKPTTLQDMQSQKSDNELDVMLTIQADQGSVLLPGNLYSRKESVQLDILLAEADMRFNSYYGDINARFSPIEASTESLAFVDGKRVDRTVSAVQLFVDGLEIYGHRLLGLPPTEPAYVCNWDFRVGKVLGECSPSFLRTLVASIRSLDFTLDDFENALPVTQSTAVPDVTFLRAFIESLRVWIIVDDAAILVGAGAIEMNLQDWARSLFSGRTNFRIPDIIIAPVDLSSINIRREHGISTVPATGAIGTSLDVKRLKRNSDHDHRRTLQIQHVRVNDQRTRRVEWMTRSGPRLPVNAKCSLPSMPVPLMPVPLSSMQDQPNKQHLLRKSSFLSASGIQASHHANTGARQNPQAKNSSAFTHSGGPGKFSRPLSYNKAKKGLLDKMPRGRPTSVITHSSPWSPPHFSLAFIEPDLSELPDMSQGPLKYHLPSETAADFTFENETTADHDGVICTLEPGLVCFLTPSMFKIAGIIMQEFSPRDPSDILDEVQMECVSQIIGEGKIATKPSKRLDIQLRIPHVHVKAINSPSNHEGLVSNEQDTYTAVIRNLKGTIRLMTLKEETETKAAIRHRTLVQASAQEISTLVSEKTAGAHHDKAAIHGTLKEVVFWMAAGEELRGHLQVRSIDFVTWSRRINYLATLIQRSVAVFDEVQGYLRKAMVGYSQSLRHLMYLLVSEGKNIPDPTFLTRPSYVLRAASDHIRTSDSWKIISRLRQIYQSLPIEAQESINRECIDLDFQLSPNAEAQILSYLQQWRAWDLAHAEESLVMKATWGSESVSATSVSQSFHLGLSLGNTRLMLDPGPKQSEIMFGDLGFVTTLQTPDKEVVHTTDLRRRLTLRTYTAKAALRLNWEICDLFDDLLAAFDSGGSPEDGDQPQDNSISTNEQPGTDVHVVFGTDIGIITLDTVNVKVALVAKGLKGSIVNQSGGVHNTLPTSTALFSTASGSAEILHQGRSIMAWRIWAPSLYLSLVGSRNVRPALDLKIAANCEKLFYNLKVDIPHLTEIVDNIVNDEVSFFLGVFKKVKRPAAQEHVQTPDSRLHVLVSLALFLDNYQISVSLLPTVTYVIAGEIARTAMTPHGHGSVRLDFDLQSHNHSFYSKGPKNGRAFSTLKMPPINGTVNLVQREKASVASIGVSIEQIELDGAALRALVDVAGRPEIERALEDSKKSFDKIKLHAESLMASPGADLEPTISRPDSQSTLLYKVNMTLVGLSVHTEAPLGTGAERSSSDLNFIMSALRFTLHNQRNEMLETFSKPQFQLLVRQISLDLEKRKHGLTSSYGSLRFGICAGGTTEVDETGGETQTYRLSSGGFDIDLFPETASLIIGIASHLQERIRGIDFAEPPIQQIRRFTRPELFDRPRIESPKREENEEPSTPAILLDSVFMIELANIQIAWIVPHEYLFSPSGRKPEDLILSVKKIELTTKKENSARLAINDLQLQMVPKSMNKRQRALNSALLPELVFNVAYTTTEQNWLMAFQAAGKTVDLRLTSDFILPASAAQASLASAVQIFRESNVFASSPTVHNGPTRLHLFGKKKLSSLLVDADVAGGVVTVQERPTEEHISPFSLIKGNSRSKAGRYEHFVHGEATGKATLRAPGVALKIEFQDKGDTDPSLNAEIKVAASKNVLNPTVVPLVLEISSSIQEAVGDEKNEETQVKEENDKDVTNGPIGPGDPSAILGRTKLNLALWVQQQEFSMTCHPIARVAATAKFDHIFMTVNTVQPAEQNRFYGLSLSFNSLSASVSHVYSRESTASFAVESIVISLMNSKHVSSRSGISAIVNISPMKTTVNAKQVQDFLLFREIWYPPEIRGANRPRAAPASPDSQFIAVQRYQQVASASAFPWNAVVSIAELGIEVDFGQGIGKTVFAISKLWASSSKSSDLEQNLCLGFERTSIDGSGRMSGFVELQNFRMRTSIRWPSEAELGNTPLIQASASFGGLRVKASFDYQPFLVADITTFAFFMFNVREEDNGAKDRLVGILEGDKVQVFCTTASASLGLALYQAFTRLVQEKQAAFEASMRELETSLRRRSAFPSGAWSTAGTQLTEAEDTDKAAPETPLTLHTDVVVTLKAVNIGAFPGTFLDYQIFKVEASDAEARFGVAVKNGRTHSGLGLTLGELRVALAGVSRSSTKAFGEISIDEVVKTATSSRGGTILKVPKVVASMETWQTALSNHIDYIFKSSFEGKVDVGWNYARISFIRGMWASHSRALASRLGKPLPRSAVQITGGPQPDDPSGHEKGQEKITAVVNVPQSRFHYTALEAPIIETPQLRDMGEATPPLEWIGLQRDRLPHLTHQIIIVTLLEVAREVEDAYSRILGSSP